MTVHPRISAGEVCQHFRDSSPLTQAGLSALTGLSRAAATDRLRTLTSRGLVGPTYEAPSTGGRPSAQYRLMPNGGAVMSVLMGAREAKVQAFDLSGQPLSAAKYAGGHGNREALSRNPRPENMLFLDVGKTIECAVLVHGRTLGVPRTSKGAFGHTIVKGTAAQACAYGLMNCLQAIAGEEAIIASLSSDYVDEPDAISDAVRRTDAAAVSALRRAGRDIGDTLLGSIHILRPEVITVRTRWPGATDLLLAGLREAAYAGGAPAVTENLVLASSSTGSPATGIALGAMDAGLAVERVDRLLSSPPNLSEQQIRRPAPRKSADRQRAHRVPDRR